MLPLKLLRSLVLGETINHHHPLFLYQNHHHHHHHHHHQHNHKEKAPLLLFLPTQELVTDTYRLATIARDIGMDLYPTPSLSHIIFSYPSSSSSSSSSLMSWSSTSLSSSSSSWYLANNIDAVPLPFPSLSSSSSSLSHLRSFVSLSKGLFKLVFVSSSNTNIIHNRSSTISNWDCCSFSLFWRLTGDRIDSMDAFARALAGMGWTLFKTKKSPSSTDTDGAKMVYYLFRKVDSKPKRVLLLQGPQGNGGECRIRELRLPTLDFRNAPLRILHYILLMTHDIFYIA